MTKSSILSSSEGATAALLILLLIHNDELAFENPCPCRQKSQSFHYLLG
jgi:hypothetical protein